MYVRAGESRERNGTVTRDISFGALASPPLLLLLLPRELGPNRSYTILCVCGIRHRRRHHRGHRYRHRRCYYIDIAPPPRCVRVVEYLYIDIYIYIYIHRLPLCVCVCVCCLFHYCIVYVRAIWNNSSRLSREILDDFRVEARAVYAYTMRYNILLR